MGNIPLCLRFNQKAACYLTLMFSFFVVAIVLTFSTGPRSEMSHWENLNGGSQTGGLSPTFSEKIGQKSFRENRALSGLIGAFSGPIGAFSGLIGTDSSAPHSRGEAAERAFLGPIGASWAKPLFAKPPFGFPQTYDVNSKPASSKILVRTQARMHMRKELTLCQHQPVEQIDCESSPRHRWCSQSRRPCWRGKVKVQKGRGEKQGVQPTISERSTHFRVGA